MSDNIKRWLIGTKWYSNITIPFVQMRYRKREYIPDIEEILLLVPAVDLARLIRKQEVSSVQILKIYINRIKVVNKIVNAVVDERFVEALKDAQKADILCNELSEKELEEKFPLLGVPFSAKEVVGVKGMSFHLGVTERKGILCDEDGSIIKYLKDAGAIPVVVTNIPELCMAWETNNLINGMTLNPYNTINSPGGSSGGEGALIASGASVFGVGTDLMGSIRIPAAFCGVFGHRPTRPIVTMDGVLPKLTDTNFLEMYTIGPMCRYVKDLYVILKIIAGTNVRQLNLDEPVDLKDLKVYYPETYRKSLDTIKIHQEIIDGVAKSIKALEKAGSEIHKTNILKDASFQTLSARIATFDSKDIVRASTIPNLRYFGEYWKWLFGKSTHCIMAIHTQMVARVKLGGIPKNERLKYEDRCSLLEGEIRKILDGNSVIITPTFPTVAYKHYGSFISFSGVNYTLFPSVFNLPATSVPVGLNKNGMPIAVQVVAGPFNDRLCLAVAKLLEKEFGGWIPPTMNKNK